LSAIMAFTDIDQTREAQTKNYVVYNDIENVVSKDVIGAMDNYTVHHFPWSQKELCIVEFTLN
jgi:hypothetical protein